MPNRKTLITAFYLSLCTLFLGLQLSHGALPKYYKEKRVFYDSLSIVLNKYIVPVGNWGLFVGALQGLGERIGDTRFMLAAENDQIELTIKDGDPVRFGKEQIETNAIELIESLSKVFDTVFEQFPDRDKTLLINGAIAGMVATLEPNSYFIEPEDLERLQAQNMGVFEGIGLEITTRDGFITVVSPYEGTPAFIAGLLPNDRILAVDGLPTKGLRIMEVSEKIRGDKGKPVTLTVERQSWETPRDIVLVRDTISHRTVKSFQLEQGYGYIRIINFLGTTDDDFAAALQNFARNSQLEGLIIDLRYNPGGLLNQSLGVADFFLNTGVIATTDGRVKSDNKTYYARPGTLPADFPIVILVNEGSASGSEIVSAALRKHQRAVLVGEKTFGKGFIQTIFPVQTGGAIRLTTSMLLTPDGEEIQNRGIMPDMNVSPTLLDYEKGDGSDPSKLPTLAIGATKDDPAVQLSLDILKRSLLLQDLPEDELQGLTPEQAAIKKRYSGLMKAVAEVSKQRKVPVF